MPYQEDRPGREPASSDPIIPVELTPELADFLRRQPDYACITQATSEGTAFVIKTPTRELATLRGTMPIGLQHELYELPSAPVICTVLTIVDRPDAPLKLETFCNVTDASQRADFAALADQEQLVLLLYDEQLRHRLTKLAPYPDRSAVPLILARATEIAAAIPLGRSDFDRAKAAVLRATRL